MHSLSTNLMNSYHPTKLNSKIIIVKIWNLEILPKNVLIRFYQHALALIRSYKYNSEVFSRFFKYFAKNLNLISVQFGCWIDVFCRWFHSVFAIKKKKKFIKNLFETEFLSWLSSFEVILLRLVIELCCNVLQHFNILLFTLISREKPCLCIHHLCLFLSTTFLFTFPLGARKNEEC